jgi:hypothetical protein
VHHRATTAPGTGAESSLAEPPRPEEGRCRGAGALPGCGAMSRMGPSPEARVLGVSP